MRQALLPSFFAYSPCRDLVRLGSPNDGGYLVCARDIPATEVLVGMGINSDWTFEKEFLEHNSCPLLAYDGSIDRKVFLKRFIRSLAHINQPHHVWSALKTYFAYPRFFQGSRQHFKKFIGVNFGDHHVAFDHVLQHLEGRVAFFKIDIEGSEYRILDDLKRYQDRISGLVVEIHDCDLHLDRIRDFIEGFKLPLVHIHANNCAPIDGKGLPLVMELTFSARAELLATAPELPNELDRPDDLRHDEIMIRIEGQHPT